MDNGGISRDGKTYKIVLRQGAQWNTSPQAEQAAMTLKRAYDELLHLKPP
jgi:hypothetical protein